MPNKKKNEKELDASMNKFEVAKELGIPLSKEDNGDLTAREAGTLGAHMKKVYAKRDNK